MLEGVLSKVWGGETHRGYRSTRGVDRRRPDGGLQVDLKHGEETWELRTDGIEGRWPVEGTHQGGRYAVRLEEERGAKGKPKAGGDWHFLYHAMVEEWRGVRLWGRHVVEEDRGVGGR
jgi:hypothetical protein